MNLRVSVLHKFSRILNDCEVRKISVSKSSFQQIEFVQMLLQRFLVILLIIYKVSALSKVIVPAVYKEWHKGQPEWMYNVTLQTKYNYTTFLYQKLNSSLPNYISTNRGTEAGVYLRYIVDHYDTFPDIAVFVHAHPKEHQEHWLEMIGCSSPQASYISINNKPLPHLCRDTHYWWGYRVIYIVMYWYLCCNGS